MLKFIHFFIVKTFKTIFGKVSNLIFIFYKEKRDDKLWLFGAWGGQKYCDNSKYMYEYMIKHHPEVRAVWVTKNKEIFYFLKKNNKPVVFSYSLEGLKSIIKAKVFIYTTHIEDINLFFITKNVLKCQLWHGVPIKNLGLAQINGSTYFPKTFKLMYFLYIRAGLSHFSSLSFFAATSQMIQSRYADSFLMKKKKLPILGQPRNDILYLNKIKRGHKVIFFAPTWRDAKIRSNPTIPTLQELTVVNEFLKKNNTKLIIKLHNTDETNISSNEELRKENLYEITVINNQPTYDIQEQLLNSDVLITDYSSIYFDYLLLNRPIIFSVFDLKEYEENSHKLYEPFNNVSPGYKAKSWEEITFYLNKLLQNDMQDGFEQKRSELRDRYWDHSVQNSNSSERVYNRINTQLEANDIA